MFSPLARNVEIIVLKSGAWHVYEELTFPFGGVGCWCTGGPKTTPASRTAELLRRERTASRFTGGRYRRLLAFPGFRTHITDQRNKR